MFLAKLSSRVGAGRAKNGWFAGGAEEKILSKRKANSFASIFSLSKFFNIIGVGKFFFKKTRPKESWDNDGFLTIVYLSH